MQDQSVGACPQKVEFFYDGENNRAVKSSATGKTYYIGKHFELHNGVPISHVFAGDLRLSKITPAGIQYYHKDHLMSTVAVTDEAGSRIESTDYIPFGQARSHSGAWSTGVRYTDQEFDSETGLYNYKARLYDAVLAIFNTPDPYLSTNLVLASSASAGNNQKFSIGSAAAERPGSIPRSHEPKQMVSYLSDTSQHLNRYAYVQNNPILYVDNNGLWPTRIHNYIIRIAFQSLPETLKLQIEKGSAYADSWKFQSPEFNKMHALRQKDESIETASDDMQRYVNEHLKEYSRLLETGQPEKAFLELGMALHPIMDLTSPSHEGFPVWEGVLNTPGYKLINHWAREQSISPNRLSKTIELIKQAME
jgi:RHS repeat-associated protein